MKSRMVRLAAACAAAVVTGIFASSVPAGAADVKACTIYGCTSTQDWGSGYGNWKQNGDIMHVCDTSADGWSIVVVATFNGGGSYQYKWHTDGAGKCTDRSYGNLPEGTEFTFKACMGKGAENYVYWESCGNTRTATA